MGRDYHICCTIALSMPVHLITFPNLFPIGYQHCANDGFCFTVRGFVLFCFVL